MFKISFKKTVFTVVSVGKIKTYNSTICLLFGMGVKTWCTTLKNHMLEVTDNRVLNTFGLKTEELRG
jgi:hypothetical protein